MKEVIKEKNKQNKMRKLEALVWLSSFKYKFSL